MLVDIHITEVATGETRIHLDDHEWTGYSEEQFSWMADRTADAGVKFQWGEGNYACDCNRFLFFYRVAHPWASGCEEPDRDCGDDAFQVKIIERGTNRVIYEEEPDPDTRAICMEEVLTSDPEGLVRSIADFGQYPIIIFGAGD